MNSSDAALDRHWIARHIPHHGAMNLLERVTAWDAQHIQCEALSHRTADNPLRARGRLGSATGIEYAASRLRCGKAIEPVPGR